ncbi:F0F1 ATP synthase subunit A [Patescibacteria group bacterium]
MIHISLAPETIFHIGSFPVTNSLLMSWLAMIIIVVIVYFGTRRKDVVPKGFQNLFEALIEGMLNLVQSVTEDRKQAIRFLPIIGTFLFFITISNWMGLFPGVGTIGFDEKFRENRFASENMADASTEEPLPTTTEDNNRSKSPAVTNTHDEADGGASTDSHSDPEAAAHAEEGEHATFTPLFRSTYSDLNMTFALALISLFATQFFGIAAIGFMKYMKKFINFSGPIPFFVGILEIVGEIAHVISFSFRLFGNVFAGEVLLVVIAFLVAYAAPVPFYFLEIFVGFIQALVFGLLTLVFFKTATAEHESH